MAEYRREKFYWFKLKEDFFKRHDIKIIKSMPNGKDYVIFYLQLLCESLSHNGNLRFSDTIPYNENMLATITDTNIDIVRSAMKLFTELGLIEILSDQTIYMTTLKNMIGSTSYGAEKKQHQRAKKQEILIESGQKGDICPPEIEKEIEIEYRERREINNSENACKQIADLFNSLCLSFPRLTTLSDARKKSIKARLNKYSVEQFKELFTKAEASDFLKGSNVRNWQANFDWLIKDSNFAKVLDGNYDNRADKKLSKASYATYDLEAYEQMLNSKDNPPLTAGEDEGIRARAEALKEKLTKE